MCVPGYRQTSPTGMHVPYSAVLQFDAKRRASPDPEIVPIIQESQKAAGLLKRYDFAHGCAEERINYMGAVCCKGMTL
eukprot:1160614-Pelagomonas_calceolata.AAC.5